MGLGLSGECDRVSEIKWSSVMLYLIIFTWSDKKGAYSYNLYESCNWWNFISLWTVQCSYKEGKGRIQA